MEHDLIAPLVRPAGDVLAASHNDTARLSRGLDRAWSLLTGFRPLDALVHGLAPGQLTVLAARPSAGKSSFARCLAERIAVDQRQPVLHFTLEMPAADVLTQMACSRAGVDLRQWRAGVVDPAGRFMMLQVLDRIERSPLFLDDSPDIAIAHIRDRARAARIARGVELVIVDGLLLVQSGVSDREQEVAFVATQLKAMAVQLSVPVFATVALDAAHADSAIADAADVMLTLTNDACGSTDAMEPRAAVIAVAKNRTGPTGECRLMFMPHHARFVNPA